MTRLEIWLPILLGMVLAGGADFFLVRSRQDLPLYRRHLRIFFTLAGTSFLGLLLFGRPTRMDAGWKAWLLLNLGAAAGLAFRMLVRLRSRSLDAWSWQRGKAQRPDPSRPLILVADPHWSDELVGLQAATRQFPEVDWLFLGDVFDVWVGLPGMVTDAQRSFLAWVRERRRGGAWVGLWMGNREYFLDRHAGLFDFMGEGVGGGLQDERLAFEHGDLINARDWQYRLWNLISRSGAMWLMFRLMPGGLATSIAGKLESQMRTTNRDYKLAFPRDAFREAAKAHPDCVFVTGHFHTHEVEANGIALPWAFEGEFMIWRDGRVEALAQPGKKDEFPTFPWEKHP